MMLLRGSIILRQLVFEKAVRHCRIDLKQCYTYRPCSIALLNKSQLTNHHVQKLVSCVFMTQNRTLAGESSGGLPPPIVNNESELTQSEFEVKCEETLDFLAERFEDLGETDLADNEFDVNFASGVITVKLGGGHGTYVINKQSPNKQIWLSSPRSGPKRYDFISGAWIYKHDGTSLLGLLSNELSDIFKTSLNFTPNEADS